MMRARGAVPGHRVEIARDHLLTVFTALPRDRWPAWVSPLLSRMSSSDLLEAVESAAGNAICGAEALRDHDPPVSLLRLGRHLGAEMTVVQPTDSDDRYPFAYVTRTGPRGWRIVAKDHYDSSVRFSVAHELAHVFLYQTECGPDDKAWLDSESTELEEALCNYLGRYLLAPDHVVMPRLMRDESAAAQVVAVLVGAFRLPVRHALLRWLDVSDRLDRRCDAALLWQQYHPLESHFIKVCCRECAPSTVQLLSSVASARSHAGRETSEAALEFWLQLSHKLFTDTVHGDCVAPSLYSPVDDVVAKTLTKCASDDDLRVILRRLALQDPELSLRPEWFATSGALAGTFVPCKRGAAGTGTIVAALAGGRAPQHMSGVEQVKIGALSGEFFVDAYAWGNASAGSRHVIQLLERRR